ncbi:MAG: sensor histidine kinase [Lachnospiraceae bacterium]|nr:sensor histidine kinase [Lachnospiraceae bacterium]
MKLDKKVFNERIKSLSFRMMMTLGAGWLLPLIVIVFGLVYVVTSMLSSQLEKTIVESMENAVEICDIKLEEMWTSSKNATYNGIIEEAYRQYVSTNNSQNLYNAVTNYLNQQYKYNANMLATMFFLKENPENVFYTYNTYSANNRGSDSYQRINYFKYFALEYVIDMSDTLDTGVGLLWHNGHMYMVRIMVDAGFTPFGVIVIELDSDAVFNSLDSVWGAEAIQIYEDGVPFFEDEKFSRFSVPDVRPGECAYIKNGGQYYSYEAVEFGGSTLGFCVKISRTSMLEQTKMLRYIVILILLFVIPMAYMIFYFFNRKISMPINELIKSAEEISNENYGYITEFDPGSTEFEYLKESFNGMSRKLEYQFQTIYKEELELRNANIMALQSQINPHFLNNTLEIINWEARMAGNENVSGMIEALGTMLSATMNRKQRKFVPLSEELSYVDAYLHIIKKRFGERFEVFREINPALLDIEVPLLIIQPIVENAVEHGVEANRSGMVAIRIYYEWDKMFIEVINDGVMSEEDRKKIDFLLNCDDKMEDEHHVSLGIRNVNRRIKIIYGNDCGLTITSNKDNETVSRIVIRMIHEGN